MWAKFLLKYMTAHEHLTLALQVKGCHELRCSPTSGLQRLLMTSLI